MSGVRREVREGKEGEGESSTGGSFIRLCFSKELSKGEGEGKRREDKEEREFVPGEEEGGSEGEEGEEERGCKGEGPELWEIKSIERRSPIQFPPLPPPPLPRLPPLVTPLFCLGGILGWLGG